MTLSAPASNSFRQFLKDKVFFGNEPTPELLAILLVYFVQGILGLARLAVSFFLKDELGLGPAEFVAGIVHIGTAPATPPDRPRPDLSRITSWMVA